MRNSKFSVVVLVLVGFLIAGMYWIFKDEPRTAQVADSAKLAPVASANTVEPAYPVAPQSHQSVTDSGPPPKLSSELLKRYNNTKNMREFVEFAIQHPEQGGTYYASTVLRQCQGITQATKFYDDTQTPAYPNEAGEKFAARAKAADALRAQCSAFLPDELSNDRISKVVDDGKKKNDPLLLASSEYINSLGSYAATGAAARARQEALAPILESQDPLLVQDLGPRIAIQVDPDSQKRGYWFDGAFYPLNSDTDVGLAIYLVPCSLGLQCNASEYEVALRCASGAGCSDGRADYVKAMLQNKPGAYERVAAVAQRMTENIKAKNTAAFFR